MNKVIGIRPHDFVMKNSGVGALVNEDSNEQNEAQVDDETEEDAEDVEDEIDADAAEAAPIKVCLLYTSPSPRD